MDAHVRRGERLLALSRLLEQDGAQQQFLAARREPSMHFYTHTSGLCLMLRCRLRARVYEWEVLWVSC